MQRVANNRVDNLDELVLGFPFQPQSLVSQLRAKSIPEVRQWPPYRSSKPILDAFDRSIDDSLVQKKTAVSANLICPTSTDFRSVAIYDRLTGQLPLQLVSEEIGGGISYRFGSIIGYDQ